MGRTSLARPAKIPTKLARPPLHAALSAQRHQLALSRRRRSARSAFPFFMSPDTFMREAIKEAEAGLRGGRGGPFGCVVVRRGEVIARGSNQVTSANDPTAHAEVTAI